MRESEMRQKIDAFLRRRMYAMLAPALGLGLVFSGCGEAASDYGTQVPYNLRDAAVGATAALPPIEEAAAADAQPDVSGEAGPGLDSQGDMGTMGVKYMAQVLDAGADLRSVAIYMAQLPTGRS